MSSKRYYELTEAERLALTPDEMLAAVKIEAITRNIKPPAPIQDMIVSQSGFHIPGDSIKVYEIALRKENHGSPEPTGLCFKTEQEALDAAKGAFYVRNDYCSLGGGKYGNTFRLYSGDVVVLCRYVPTSQGETYYNPLNVCDDGAVSEEFDKLCTECRDDQSRIRQAAYNKEVRKRKRAEYVQLAKGDLDVAAAFWCKVESGDFPNEDGL